MGVVLQATALVKEVFLQSQFQRNLLSAGYLQCLKNFGEGHSAESLHSMSAHGAQVGNLRGDLRADLCISAGGNG